MFSSELDSILLNTLGYSTPLENETESGAIRRRFTRSLAKKRHSLPYAHQEIMEADWSAIPTFTPQTQTQEALTLVEFARALRSNNYHHFDRPIENIPEEIEVDGEDGTLYLGTPFVEKLWSSVLCLSHLKRSSLIE